jgi:muramidase (phage lysozyme)
MNTKQITPFGYMLVLSVMISLLAGCLGTSKRPLSDLPPEGRTRPVPTIELDPNTLESPPSSQRTFPDSTPLPVTQAPRPFTPSREVGWILTRSNQGAVMDIVLRAPEFHITQMQLGGDIITYIDDLIFNAEKQQMVREIAQQNDRVGIDTYIWCNELNLDSPSFRFHPSDPLTIARKSAYETVFRDIPQLDGIVLVLGAAKINPWNAQIPPELPPVSNPERIRFIIDMVRSVVVDQLGKRLIVRPEMQDSEEQGWFIAAMEGYPSDLITVMSPVTSTRQIGVGQIHPLIHSLETFHPLLEIGMVGEMFGGPAFLYCQPDMLAHFYSQRPLSTFKGAVARVQSEFGNPFYSPNEINIHAFSELTRQDGAEVENVWQSWINERYDLQPMSQSEITLRKILRHSFEWGQKMVLAKGTLPVLQKGQIPQSVDALRAYWREILPYSDPRVEQFSRHFSDNNRQFFAELAQESFEATNQIDTALQELSTLRQSLPPSDYNQYYSKLTFQKMVSQVCFYAKQCIWGYLYWKETRDEMEALYLEEHLRNLERLAQEVESTYGPNAVPGNPRRIQALVSSIRADFPQVVMGYRPRTWNQLSNISIQQVGPDRVEISWKSAEPCISKVFIAEELPVFNRSEEVSQIASIDHRQVIGNLQPGQGYYIKIQCTSENNEVTNSGNFFYRLEPQMAM